MRFLCSAIAFTVLLPGLNYGQGMGQTKNQSTSNKDCRKESSGPWDDSKKTYNIDNIDDDLKDPNHPSICISSGKKEAFHVKAEKSSEFQLKFASENTASECDPSTALRIEYVPKDAKCGKNATVTATGAAKQECNYHMYPVACQQTSKSTADPHVRLMP
jgi:hypothetical protein